MLVLRPRQPLAIAADVEIISLDLAEPVVRKDRPIAIDGSRLLHARQPGTRCWPRDRSRSGSRTPCSRRRVARRAPAYRGVCGRSRRGVEGSVSRFRES